MGKLSPDMDRKRFVLVRDWWRLILWKVRLRRASKTGIYHPALLEAERLAGPTAQVQDPVRAVRAASVKDYNFKEETQKGETLEMEG